MVADAFVVVFVVVREYARTARRWDVVRSRLRFPSDPLGGTAFPFGGSHRAA